MVLGGWGAPGVLESPAPGMNCQHDQASPAVNIDPPNLLVGDFWTDSRPQHKSSD